MTRRLAVYLCDGCGALYGIPHRGQLNPVVCRPCTARFGGPPVVTRQLSAAALAGHLDRVGIVPPPPEVRV